MHYVQQPMPSFVKPSTWVKIQFVQFGSIVLLVEAIFPNRIVGFDLGKCEKVSLRLRHDKAVMNAENWPAQSYEILQSDTQIKNEVAAKRRNIEVRLRQLRTQLEYLERFKEKHLTNTKPVSKKRKP